MVTRSTVSHGTEMGRDGTNGTAVMEWRERPSSSIATSSAASDSSHNALSALASNLKAREFAWYVYTALTLEGAPMNSPVFLRHCRTIAADDQSEDRLAAAPSARKFAAREAGTPSQATPGAGSWVPSIPAFHPIFQN